MYSNLTYLLCFCKFYEFVNKSHLILYFIKKYGFFTIEQKKMKTENIIKF